MPAESLTYMKARVVKIEVEDRYYVEIKANNDCQFEHDRFETAPFRHEAQAQRRAEQVAHALGWKLDWSEDRVELPF